MDPSGPLVPLPPAAALQRASDLDRSVVCDQLAAHFAAGRLQEAELDARLSAAVAAPTVLELRRLVSDLPAPAPVQPAPSGPPSGWRALDVVALLLVLGCLGFAGVAVLALGFDAGPELLVAGLLGGTVAAVGGAALMHLVHRRWQCAVQRAAEDRAGQRPRIA